MMYAFTRSDIRLEYHREGRHYRRDTIIGGEVFSLCDMDLAALDTDTEGFFNEGWTFEDGESAKYGRIFAD